MSDLPGLPVRGEMYVESTKQVQAITDQYEQGLLTEEERHTKVIEIWAQVKEKLPNFPKALPIMVRIFND